MSIPTIIDEYSWFNSPGSSYFTAQTTMIPWVFMNHLFLVKFPPHPLKVRRGIIGQLKLKVHHHLLTPGVFMVGSVFCYFLAAKGPILFCVWLKLSTLHCLYKYVGGVVWQTKLSTDFSERKQCVFRWENIIEHVKRKAGRSRTINHTISISWSWTIFRACFLASCHKRGDVLGPGGDSC